MSDSTSHLDAIAAGDSAKETKAMVLFDSMSQNALFGRRASTTSALTWGYFGGKYRRADGTILVVANATIALTDAATNYLLETDGVVSKVTAAPDGWPGPLLDDLSPATETGATALYQIVCAGGLVTSYTDYRAPQRGAPGADGGGDVDGPASSVDNRVVFFDGTTGKLIKDSGLTLAGSNTGDQTSVSGNAGTATALQTARTIGGTSFDGSANITQPFDVTGGLPGVPAASAPILPLVPVARAVTFPDDFAGSYGKASVAATASAAFDIKKNGSSVGTMTFALGATSATFVTAAGALTLAAGDYLQIIAPATPDATLADVGVVLAGTR